MKVPDYNKLQTWQVCIDSIQVSSQKLKHSQNSSPTAGVGKLRPCGQMRPVNATSQEKYAAPESADRLLGVYKGRRDKSLHTFYISEVRFQILKATRKRWLFWEVAPCSRIESGRRFRNAFCSDDGSSNYLWNICQFLRDYTTQHPIFSLL
jgi:hypothetical protein